MGRPRQASSEAEAAGAGKPWASPYSRHTRRLLHAWRNSEGCSPPAVLPGVHLERKEVPEGECGPIRLLRRKESTQTRGLHTCTQTHSAQRMLWSKAQPSAVVFHRPEYLSFFGLWAELRILIIMAQGHGDLSVCVLGNYTENKNNANSGKPFIKDLLCARPCTDSWETVMNKRGKLLCPCGWREQLMNELHK